MARVSRMVFRVLAENLREHVLDYPQISMGGHRADGS